MGTQATLLALLQLEIRLAFSRRVGLGSDNDPAAILPIFAESVALAVRGRETMDLDRTFVLLWLTLLGQSCILVASPSLCAQSPEPELARESKFQPLTVPTKLAAFPDSPNSVGETSNIATPQLIAWLTAMVQDNLPPTYEDDRKWGQQKEVWDGVKVWREDGRLETKRKTKLVNAGTWTRYTIAIVEPEKNLHVEFHRLETLSNGSIAFAVSVECPLEVFGRLSQWARDVQVISLSANADAACRLTIEGTVEFQMNLLKLPPDIAIKPHVDNAHIDLTQYRVRRISQVGGDFAKVLGNSLRGVVDEKLDDMNAKLVDKINAQLAKNSKRLSFSTQDWLRSKLPLPAVK